MVCGESVGPSASWEVRGSSQGTKRSGRRRGCAEVCIDRFPLSQERSGRTCHRRLNSQMSWIM